MNQYKKGLNSYFNESSHKKRVEGGVSTEGYELDNNYLELNLVKCMDSSGNLSREFITEALIENIKEIVGNREIVPLKNVIGYEVEKSFCEEGSPNEQTLSYMMSLNLINPAALLTSHNSNSLNKILLRMKPIFFKISNIAAAIIYSKS